MAKSVFAVVHEFAILDLRFAIEEDHFAADAKPRSVMTEKELKQRTKQCALRVLKLVYQEAYEWTAIMAASRITAAGG